MQVSKKTKSRKRKTIHPGYSEFRKKKKKKRKKKKRLPNTNHQDEKDEIKTRLEKSKSDLDNITEKRN